jgi:streptogramin lyase
MTGSLINAYPANASPFGVAVDKANNVWYVDNSAAVSNINELVAANGYAQAVFTNPPQSTLPLRAMAIDQNQNIWAAGYTTTSGTVSSAIVFPNTGTVAAPAYTSTFVQTTLPSGNSTYGMAIDASGNAWLGSAPSATALSQVVLSGSGASVALSAGTQLGGPGSSYRPTFDGGGVAWIGDVSNSRIYGLNPNTGGVRTYANGCYIAPGATACTSSTTDPTTYLTKYPRHVVVDSSGALWSADSDPGLIVQTLGLASPAWPLQAAGMLGVEP